MVVWAGFINWQWNGALTGRITALLIPKSLESFIAFSTANISPLITTWPSELSLAMSQTPKDFTLSETSFAVSRFVPINAAIAPFPIGTASCIALPLNLNKIAHWCREKTSAAVIAVYSPRECPQT